MAQASPGLAVVLVGGLGTRVRHLLQGRPKPLAPVAGRPFLEWVLRYLREQGLERVVLAAGYAADQVAGFAASMSIEGLVVQVVAEPEPRGTAGAFVHCWGELQPPDANVLVLNGDSLALTPLAPLYAAVDDSSALLAVEVEDVSRYGSLALDAQGRLAGFSEKRAGGGRGLVNAGVYLFPRAALDAFPRAQPLGFETDVFPALLAARARVQVVRATCPFLDIGTEASMREAARFIDDNRRWFGA
jgi:D-glycero-alpha-D-manno-heptose 1-phosphate guanylyltransferase